MAARHAFPAATCYACVEHIQALAPHPCRRSCCVHGRHAMPGRVRRVMSDALAVNNSLSLVALRNQAGARVLPWDSSPECFSTVSLPPSVAVGRWFFSGLAGSGGLPLGPCSAIGPCLRTGHMAWPSLLLAQTAPAGASRA